MQARLSPPKRVDSQVISEVIEKLWELLWTDCKGIGTWNRNPDRSYDYSFFPEWGAHDQMFDLRGIEGSLHGKPYSMDFVGFSGGCLELTLEDVTYKFSADPRYGSFSQEGVRHLTSGSACFGLRHSDEAVSDFLKAPYRNNRTSWLMTPEREQEALQFINELISVIKQRKDQSKIEEKNNVSN